MGVAPFLLAASVTGVIAQRLVRKLCPKCKEKYEAGSAVVDAYGLSGREVTLYRAKGCKACKGTGYRGRTGLFELMEVTESIKDLIVKGASASRIMARAQEEGTIPLVRDGVEKALSGETSIEEVARVSEAKVDAGRGAAVEPAAVEEREGTAGQVEAAAGRAGTIDLDEYRRKIAGWLAKR
jgi:type II secretory ATPase GspE/PulE/Tfp pilus assembly ATPase PilB-like protein